MFMAQWVIIMISIFNVLKINVKLSKNTLKYGSSLR